MKEVQEYRKKVYKIASDVIANHPDLEDNNGTTPVKITWDQNCGPSSRARISQLMQSSMLNSIKAEGMSPAYKGTSLPTSMCFSKRAVAAAAVECWWVSQGL